MKVTVSESTPLGGTVIYFPYLVPKQMPLYKLGQFGFKKIGELPGNKCYTLPSTKKSRSGLVKKLETQMGVAIPVELVDIVVGFL